MSSSLPAGQTWPLIVVLSLVGPFVRDELIVVPAIAVGSLCLQSLISGRARAYVAKASNLRRVALVLGLIVALIVCGVLGFVGLGEVADALSRPGIMRDQTLWAWGSMLAGLGVLPVVIGVASAIPAPGVSRSKPAIAFTALLGTSLVIITAYVSVKGAYQAAIFEARVEERNLLYLTPLLFIALARFAATRELRIWALMATAALAAWSISDVWLTFNGLAGDAPGLAILSRLHEDYELGFSGARRLLYLLLALSVLIGLAPTLLRSHRRVAGWIVVGAAVLSIGWAGWAETAAAKYSNDFAALFADGLPEAEQLDRPGNRRRTRRLHRPEDRRPQRHLVDGVLEPRRSPRLEPRWHGARPRPGAHTGPDGD